MNVRVTRFNCEAVRTADGAVLKTVDLSAWSVYIDVARSPELRAPWLRRQTASGATTCLRRWSDDAGYGSLICRAMPQADSGDENCAGRMKRGAGRNTTG